MWVYFLRRKSDASSALEQFFCDTRTDGEVEIIRTDNGSEFHGRFQQLCDERRVTRELTGTHRPEFNGVTGRGLAMLEVTSRAARIQAKHIFTTVACLRIESACEVKPSIGHACP